MIRRKVAQERLVRALTDAGYCDIEIDCSPLSGIKYVSGRYHSAAGLGERVTLGWGRTYQRAFAEAMAAVNDE